MLKIIVVALAAVVAYYATGRAPMPVEVKGLVAGAFVVSAIWFGIARVNDV